MIKFLPGIYLGWGLGSNDAANVFGPQAYSGIISYRGAVVLTAVFVILGSLIEGDKCFAQIGQMTATTGWVEVFIATLCAAIMMNLMSYLKIPASSSHSIVGSLIGVSLAFGRAVSMAKVWKSVICWIITPIGAAVMAFILYHLFSYLWASRIKNLVVLNLTIKIAAILIGCYGAYSLGANNLANIVGSYVGTGLISPLNAKILGGLAIAFGVITYSKNVMQTVGTGITVLEPFSALVSILSGAILLHIFAEIGVPVSSSQAIVGAVFGVGLVKGTRTVSYKKLAQIFTGWVATLAGTIFFGFLISSLYKLF